MNPNLLTFSSNKLKIKHIHAETFRRMVQRNVTQYDAFIREKNNPEPTTMEKLQKVFIRDFMSRMRITQTMF